MDQVLREWAQDQLRDEVQSFADDPHGYCGDDIAPLAAWRRIEHIARELGMDATAVLRGEANSVEIDRLSRLTGQDFS